MAKDRKSKKTQSQPPALNAADVREWILANPEFLRENDDLISQHLPENRVSEEGVVNMQSFLLEKLQRETRDLKDLQGDLVAAARGNLHTQNIIHRSILEILGATSFNQFVHILTQDLTDVLEVDVITLCVEDSLVPLPDMTGLQRLKKGSVERVYWPHNNMVMRAEASGTKAVFGPAKDLVASDCLIRLEVPALHAGVLLGIGSRDPNHFHPDQGTELIEFFAGCVEALLGHWVEQGLVRQDV
ncbi:MAG: DUF484 family protein [Sneathiella sp.]|nr:DUF484 family protein [Sneathiella sp.]